MKVLKFGGTSVGSPEAIRKVAAIIKTSSVEHRLIIVVSAVGGVTNQLVSLGQMAVGRDESYESLISDLEIKHQKIYHELMDVEDKGPIAKIFNQLKEIAKGVFLLKELTPRTNDYIQSCGERLSAYMVSEYLKKLQIDTHLFDSRDYLITDKQFGNAAILWSETRNRLRANKGELNQVNLFPGFIASTQDKETSTLGRGGSDYTASLLANILEADALEIWTDVNGLMTADPRLVKNARLLEHVSYEEALELSHFGAKVLYPPSIQPALDSGVPIWIKNTFDPDGLTTVVTKSGNEKEGLISGISSIKDIAMLNLSGNSMVGIPSFSFRLFRALSEAKINVILITQASSEHSISVCIASIDADRAVAMVQQEFFSEIEMHKIDPVSLEKDLSILALVGSNMKNQVGVSGTMFKTLGSNGVSIRAIAQGSSERNISAVIQHTDLKKALNTLHESFFLSEFKRVNLFVVGVGNVGKAFLDQVKAQQSYLAKEHLLNLQVIGIANSRQCLFDVEGINIEEWETKLRSGDTCDINGFVSKMDAMNLRNSVFIDITASYDIAKVYKQVLSKSISVVTPNKIAATREISEYLELKEVARKYKSQFLFETNVAAGLPVLSTLSDLVRSGDKVHAIEAVLSGTLNYLFNTYDATQLFSDVIKEAKELGLTEPDPRLDLSGEDVMRKLLILMRESGLEVEMEDIKLSSFLPESCQNSTDLNSFYDQIDKANDYFQRLYQNAKNKKSQLRVVASYSAKGAEVSLKEIPVEHPFYFLEGKDNIVLFETDRYMEQPLVIKGAGAGAEVTASGIFADVLRLVNE